MVLSSSSAVCTSGQPTGGAFSEVTEMERLLTVDQAAEELNTTTRFIRRLIAERRICFHHVGRHVRITERDLEAFVEAGRVQPVDVRDRAGASA